MTAIELLSHPLAQRLTCTLAHFVWQGFFIAVALAMVIEIVRPRSVNVRYALSLAALVMMLAIVPFTWLVIGDQLAEVVTSAAPVLETSASTAESVVANETADSGCARTGARAWRPTT